MNLNEFKGHAAAHDAPEASWPAELKALWWDLRGDWKKAHTLCQEPGSVMGDWIHAYLHRVEGDPGNAAYWYARAKQPVCTDELEVERDTILADVLETVL